MLFFTLLTGLLATLVACEADASRLVELSNALPDGVIRVTDAQVSDISQYPREHYTLIVLTSTSDQHGCTSCADLDKMLARVSKAWLRDYKGSDHLFMVSIDLADASNRPIFDKLGIKEVPYIWLVPPSQTADQHRPRKLPVDKDDNVVFGEFDIFLEPHLEFSIPQSSFNDQVFQLADWLGQSIKRRIVLREDNQILRFILYFGITFGSIAYLKRRGPSTVRRTVDKKKIYMVLTMFVLLTILGGYSFTTINGIAFLVQNDKGEPIYISGGVHWQFGDEIALVGGHYFLLGLVLVLMCYLGKLHVGPEKLFTSEKHKAFCVLALNVILYFLYSSYTSMYQRKDHEYPYHMLHLF